MIPGGLGHPRVLRGNTALMRHVRPPFGTYFLNFDTDSIHQWNGVEWEGVGGSGTPEKTALLLLFQKQAERRQAAAVAQGAGSGSTPGIRVGTDPSVNDPALFTAPPAPTGLPRYGGIDVPILSGRGGDGRGSSGYGGGSGVSGGMTTGAPGVGAQVFDTFDGDIIANGWGTNRPTHQFTYVDTGGGAFHLVSVLNGYGRLQVGGAGIGGFCHQGCTSAGAPWNNAAGFDMVIKFMFMSVPGIGQSVSLLPFITLVGSGVEITISSDIARGEFRLADAGPVQAIVKTDWVAGQWYYCRWQRGTPGGVLSQAKLWTGLGEPVAWTLIQTGASPGNTTIFEWEWANNGTVPTAVLECRIDSIEFR